MASNIHEAIAEIMGEVGYVKKSKSPNLNYSFAGEAALIEALRPHMVERGVYCYVLAINDVAVEDYQTSRGSSMRDTRLVMTVRFHHAASDTSIDVQAIGEGSDMGDKSANKASTGAYKYALRQTFCIETGDDPDKEASVPRQSQQRDVGELVHREGRPTPPQGKPLEPSEVVAAPPAQRPPAPSMKEEYERTQAPKPRSKNGQASDAKRQAIAAVNQLQEADIPLSPILREHFGGRGIGSLSDDECATLVAVIQEKVDSGGGDV